MTADGLIATNNLSVVIKNLEESVVYLQTKHANRMDLIHSINKSILNLKRVRESVLELDINVQARIKLNEWS